MDVESAQHGRPVYSRSVRVHRTANAVVPVVSEPPPVAAPAPIPAIEPVRRSRTAPGAVGGFSWARSDGQLISGNAELTAQARADLAECKG